MHQTCQRWRDGSGPLVHKKQMRPCLLLFLMPPVDADLQGRFKGMWQRWRDHAHPAETWRLYLSKRYIYNELLNELVPVELLGSCLPAPDHDRGREKWGK